jgi:hypothetical protein
LQLKVPLKAKWDKITEGDPEELSRAGFCLSLAVRQTKRYIHLVRVVV